MLAADYLLPIIIDDMYLARRHWSGYNDTSQMTKTIPQYSKHWNIDPLLVDHFHYGGLNGHF